MYVRALDDVAPGGEGLIPLMWLSHSQSAEYP